MKQNFIISIAVVVVLLGLGIYYAVRKPAPELETIQVSTYGEENSPAPAVPTPESNITTITTQKKSMHTVTIETNKGTFVFETYDQDAPNTVKNFVDLAEKGFYDDVIFHRVIEGFMIQGGDPTGTGTGGPGYKFADELNPNTPSAKEGYKKGVVAMANAGPNTNGSQFFIMLEDNALPHNYTIFGKVVKGQEVVDAIGSVDTNASDRPLEDVVMKSVTVATK